MQLDSTTQSPEIAEETRSGEVLAKGLGVFSLGLGLAELVTPRAVAGLIGLDDCGDNNLLLRGFGAREIAAGVSIFAMPRRALPLWMRVAGDALDLAALGLALRNRRNSPGKLWFAIANVLGVTALDVFTALKLQRTRLGEPVIRSVTVNRSPRECYELWRDFERLPEFMQHLESVQMLDEYRSHWTASSPLGIEAEWEAELVDDAPGELISWRSIAGSEIPNRGSVMFRDAPGGRGTEVIVEMQVASPIAKIFAGPEIEGDLRRFKQLLEIGEITQSDATLTPGMHPAQPVEFGKGV